jgi:hypothetical protein
MRGARLQISIRIVFALLAIATTGMVHARMDTTAQLASELGESFIPDPQHARVAALGFEAVVADYYWLRAVQLVGGALGHRQLPTGQIGRLIDVVTTVDPWVDHPYRFAALWLTDSEENVRTANRLLVRGIAHHPTDWRNRYHLGFNHFFYLGEHEQAADALEAAVLLPRSPRYLGPLVARLRLQQGGLETAAAFLAELARTTEDPYKRAEYEKSLDEIQIERAARFLDEARDEYIRRHGRDITRVEDLVAGPESVLSELPRAHPLFDGFRWQLDDETFEIVSSYYRKRYQLHAHPADQERRQRWKALREWRERSSG